MTKDHSDNGDPHQHTAREILACPADSPLQRDVEACACGAQRLVDVPGKPPGQWTQVIPIPYDNPIGHVEAVLADGGIDFTIMDPVDFGNLRVGDRVTVLRYAPEAGSIVRIQGGNNRGRRQERRGRSCRQVQSHRVRARSEEPATPGDPGIPGG